MTVHMIYITCGSIEEARTIGKALVVSRLAACANILAPMNSFYYWEGKLQDDQEAVLIAKTTEKKVPDAVAKVKQMHSYDLPAIVALPVSGGNTAFLDWIAGEVSEN